MIQEMLKGNQVNSYFEEKKDSEEGQQAVKINFYGEEKINFYDEEKINFYDEEKRGFQK